MLTFIVLLLILGGGGAIFFAVRGKSGSKSLSLSSRLGRYGLAGPDAQKEAAADPFEKPSQNAVSESLDRMMGAGKLSGSIKGKLERADLKMTAGEFLAIAGVVFLVACVIGFILNSMVGILAFIAAPIAGAVGPWV